MLSWTHNFDKIHYSSTDSVSRISQKLEPTCDCMYKKKFFKMLSSTTYLNFIKISEVYPYMHNHRPFFNKRSPVFYFVFYFFVLYSFHFHIPCPCHISFERRLFHNSLPIFCITITSSSL